MADPTSSGGAIAATITACGGAVAGVLGAIALFGRRKPSDVVAEHGDPEDRTSRLRERITALETRTDDMKQDIEHHDEEISLLRSNQITSEGFARLVENLKTPPPRRAPRKRT